MAKLPVPQQELPLRCRQVLVSLVGHIHQATVIRRRQGRLDGISITQHRCIFEGKSHVIHIPCEHKGKITTGVIWKF